MVKVDIPVLFLILEEMLSVFTIEMMFAVVYHTGAVGWEQRREEGKASRR